MTTRPQPSGRDVLVVAAVIAVALAWPLRSPPIGLHGEAREGLVVQDIVEHGRWILPLREGEIPSKPPLFHWIAAAAGRVVGVSDAVVRLPSALAALVMAGATFALGGVLGGRRVGWLALGALLGTLQFWLAATAARVDMVFAACVTLALVGFQRWYTTGSPSARVLFWLAVGAAVLAKGPVGLVLPALVIGLFLARQRDLGALRGLASSRAAAVALGLDLLWYALAVRRGGADFVARQLVYENVDRFLGLDAFGRAAHDPGFRHFALRMPIDFARHLFPWNLALVVAAVRGWRGACEDAGGRFLHAWWIAILVFFSVASGKRSVYLLPLVPAVAVLAARVLGTAQIAAHRLVPTVAAWVLAIAVTAQAVRVYDARRASLAGFATAIAEATPPGAVVYAGRGLAPPVLLVLGYRLDRLLPREPRRCTADAYVVLPGDGTHAPDGVQVLASSGRARAPVALARRPCAYGVRSATASRRIGDRLPSPSARSAPAATSATAATATSDGPSGKSQR